MQNLKILKMPHVDENVAQWELHKGLPGVTCLQWLWPNPGQHWKQ